MKIDIFNHIFPKPFFDKYIDKGSGGKDIGKRVANIRTIVDVEARLRVLDEFGDYVQVISLPLPPLEIIAAPAQSPQLARDGNDGLAELVRRHDRFIGFVAALPMNNPDAALAEMQRAIDDLGAFGVQMYTNAAGKPLDAPEFLPLFEEAARRDVPIWIHPARGADFSDYQSETRSQYEIWWTFGWPYETSVAMARLVFGGYFDRFPDLKIITHHMGGMVPYFEGRVGYGWDQLGTRTSDRDYVSLLKSMKKRPIDYFKSFYADTALFGAASATRCGYDFFGIDKILFASDMPFEPSPGLYARETIRCVDALGLSADQADRIYRRNAERILKIDPGRIRVDAAGR
ncbi:MAG TPA: amidohydrolase family protein [Vicinamibacterales bacterium]|nr:amidohydrolase family protein [Vicinamibacterales bacterium]